MRPHCVVVLSSRNLSKTAPENDLSSESESQGEEMGYVSPDFTTSLPLLAVYTAWTSLATRLLSKVFYVQSPRLQPHESEAGAAL